jgi:hypothetical protein
MPAALPAVTGAQVVRALERERFRMTASLWQRCRQDVLVVTTMPARVPREADRAGQPGDRDSTRLRATTNAIQRTSQCLLTAYADLLLLN